MAFDPQAATAAYIDSLGAEALSKAASYTAGNHWLLLWGLGVSALSMITGLCRRARGAPRWSGRPATWTPPR